MTLPTLCNSRCNGLWRKRVLLGCVHNKSVSDLNVTIAQPRNMNIIGKNVSIGLNFSFLSFARIKNLPFDIYSILKRNKEKTKKIQGIVFLECKTNHEEI